MLFFGPEDSGTEKYSIINAHKHLPRMVSDPRLAQRHNATRFGVNPVKSALQNKLFNRVNQIFMAITLSSVSGISRICKIAAFSGDGLIKALLFHRIVVLN